MKAHAFFLLMVIGIASPSCAQRETETQNIILITLDGVRWQEIFNGADKRILSNHKFVTDSVSVRQFAGQSPMESRQRLMPFFWSTIETQGQLYGNRLVGSDVNCSNPYWFSYPGYHEMLVGAVDRKVCTNRKVINPNTTVFDFLQSHPDFSGRISAYTTWDVFPYILREKESGIPVNSGIEAVTDLTTENETVLNRLQFERNWRGDSITFHLAFEHLKSCRPRVLYIALDRTDIHAHAGRYDQYLLAAHEADQWIGNLWSWLQTQDDYKDKTTLIISTDHGRGKNARRNWRDHGRLTFGSDQIWIAVIGPDTPGQGEIKNSSQLYQKQIAKTFAAFVSMDYENKFPVGEVIHSMIRPATLVAVTGTVVPEIVNKK